MNRPTFRKYVFPFMATSSLLYYSTATIPLSILAYEADVFESRAVNTTSDQEEEEEVITYPGRGHENPVTDDHHLNDDEDPSIGHPEPEEDLSYREEELEPELENLLEPEEDEVDSGGFNIIAGGARTPSPNVRIPAPQINGTQSLQTNGAANLSRNLSDEPPRIPAPRPTQPEPTTAMPTTHQTEPGVASTVNQRETASSRQSDDTKDSSSLPQTGMERARPWLIGVGLVGLSGAAIYFKNKQD